jgi:hypothetical protein
MGVAAPLELDPEKWEPIFRFSEKIMRQQKLDPEKWEPVFRKDHASTKA